MAYGVKTGGRVKGTPNKRTAEVQQILEQLNCNPIEGMAIIAENVKLDITIRLNAYKELAQYIYPKRKAIEHSGGINMITHEEALLMLDGD
jgi:hypothetical protein